MPGAGNRKTRGAIAKLREIDNFLCSVLRGEGPAWPRSSTCDFETNFLSRAEEHGVQALVRERAQYSGEWPHWPESVRDKLDSDFRAGVALELFRARSISRLFEAMNQAGIPFLVTKGEALARTYYPNTALRPRVDTDVFIHMRDIESTRKVLLAAGYEIVPPLYKSHQFMVFWKDSRATITFDFHWRILNNPGFARAIGFEEALEQSIALPGLAGVRTLCPEHALLLACMHRKGSTFHDEDRLIWLYDIHLILTAMTAEQMSKFVDDAVRLALQDVCIDGLEAARVRFRSGQAQLLIARLVARRPFNHKTQRNRYATSNLALLIDDMKSLPGARARRALLMELFIPSPEALMEKFHKSNRTWLPWLYVKQLVRGIVKRLSLQ